MASGAFLEEESLSENDELFNAFFDGELNAQERAAFEARLESDEAFRTDYEAFFQFMGGLHELPFAFAPDDFVENVQGRIRSRSRGRFFADQYFYRARVPYEVVCVVMIVVMASAYLLMGVPPDSGMQDVNLTPVLTTPR